MINIIFSNILLIAIALQNEVKSDLLLRSEKIYSVMTILMVIFIVLIVFLVYADRRVKRLEKEFENNKH